MAIRPPAKPTKYDDLAYHATLAMAAPITRQSATTKPTTLKFSLLGEPFLAGLE